MTYIKNLLPGQSFTTPDSRGTVYFAQRVQVGESKTVVDYKVDGIEATFTVPSLATCTIV